MGGRGDDTSDDGSDREWVLDENFVAGGIREDSLRHPRARASTPLGNPSGPRDWTPDRPAGLPRRRRRLPRWAALALVAAVGVAGVVHLAATSDDRGPTPIAASASPSRPAGTSTGDQQVDGITPVTPIGTCLSGTAAPGADLDVRSTPCEGRHDYELVAFERASGPDRAYPDDSYWHGPVARRCYADVVRYVAQPRDRWPDHLGSTQFVPQRTGWAAGDRVVYCLAQWQPAASGSVAHLHPARRSVIGAATAAPSSSSRARPTETAADDTRTVTGRLFVLTHGSDVCLAVRSADYTGPVESASAGLSWRASVDSAGRPDRAGSGIAVAPQARSDNLRWHSGDRVTLTGTVDDALDRGCASATVFDFVTAD